MKTHTIDHGLIVDPTTTPPTAAGYIFNFTDHGAYCQDGRVGELTQAQVDTHNRLLAEAEWTAMLKHGRGTLYYDGSTISDWPGVHRLPKSYARISQQYGCCTCQRVDVWFTIPDDDNSHWHGVQRGDNQMLRVRRLKT